MSAALGKTGAAVGTQAFTPIQNNLGKKSVPRCYHHFQILMFLSRWTFIIAAICGVTGILVTYFFVPDMTGWSISLCNRDLPTDINLAGVDLADEDRKFLEYLHENGWEGDIGEEDSVFTDESSIEKK